MFNSPKHGNALKSFMLIVLVVVVLMHLACEKSKGAEKAEETNHTISINDTPEGVEIIFDGVPHLVKNGLAGKEGRNGLNGAPGPKGEKGDKGDGSGAPGPKGDKGDAGNAGPPGTAGSPGPTGVPGPKGNVGQNGPIGPQGHPGRDGTRGEKGDPGASGRTITQLIGCEFIWEGIPEYVVNYQVFTYSDNVREAMGSIYETEKDILVNSSLWLKVDPYFDYAPINIGDFTIKLDLAGSAYIRHKSGRYATFGCERL